MDALAQFIGLLLFKEMNNANDLLYLKKQNEGGIRLIEAAHLVRKDLW